MGSPIFDSTFGTGQFEENREVKGQQMAEGNRIAELEKQVMELQDRPRAADVQALREQARLLWAVVIPLQNQVRQLETWIGQSPKQRALDTEGQKLNERADVYFPDKPI